MDTGSTSQAPLPAIGAGHLLDNRYLLGERIGEGGAGVVHEATHVLLARKVAVKIIESQAGMSQSVIARMSKEGQNLAAVAHPHVVNVFDFGFSSTFAYLVMELLSGESLDARIRRTGRLDAELALSITRQVLRGLTAAHARGIVHRDLKPANVFLLQTGDGWPHAKIIDFGLSVLDGTNDSRPRIAGTPSYLPPEQARGEAVDPRADIYAVGATLFELLTGRPPFVARNLGALLAAIQLDAPPAPSSLRRDLPPAIDAVVVRALAKNREDRFASAEEMLAAMDDLRLGPARSRRPYVLVADADPASGAACGRVVASFGRTALLVRDGLEALEAVHARGAPELLVVSLSLPGVDGLTLLAELRERPDAKGVPAIVASRIPSLRRAANAARDALGVAAIVNDAGDEEEIARAMKAVLGGERPAEPERTTEIALSEARRLAKVRRLRLGDDAPPDEALQRFVAEVAQAFHVPTALVSIVMENRQWFQAYSGLDGPSLAERGTARDLAFCSHVVAGRERLVVPDATVHPVFHDHPFVKDGTVGGYAGSPLITPTGEVLGTLCILNKSRLDVSAEMLDALDALARRVAGELEMFGHTMEDLGASADLGPPVPGSSEPSRDDVASLSWSGELPAAGEPVSVEGSFADPGCAALLFDEGRRVLRASGGLERLFGVAPQEVVGLTRDEVVQRIEGCFVDPVAFARAVRVLPQGPFAARAALRLRPLDGEQRPRPALWFASPVRTPVAVHQLEVYRESLPRPDPREAPLASTRGEPLR